MSKTQITHLKLARYPELVSGPARPIHWDVDPSSVCDHRCRGCPYIFDGPIDPMLGIVRPETAKDKRTFLHYSVFYRFARDAAEHGAKAITFVGGGEPTLHPRFPEMMDTARHFGMKFGVITHLGRKYDDAFFEAVGQATWVRVSVNAAHRDTYLKHQGRDHFDQMLFNMERLAKLGVRVGMSFLITNDNYREIVGAAQLAEFHGASFIQYKPIIEIELGKAYDGIEEDIRAALFTAKGLTRDRFQAHFQVLDQWTARLDELKRHAAGEFSGPCHVQRFNPKLGANGVVYTCCELAYSTEGAIGSIYEEPLSAILERAGTMAIDQKGCPHCWDKPLNTLINEGKLDTCTPPPESVDQEFV